MDRAAKKAIKVQLKLKSKQQQNQKIQHQHIKGQDIPIISYRLNMLNVNIVQIHF
jgi:hypothetical protein